VLERFIATGVIVRNMQENIAARYNDPAVFGHDLVEEFAFVRVRAANRASEGGKQSQELVAVDLLCPAAAVR
jgi:hypothetical protein